jgi:uncharacterized protein (DUF1499 family)/multisubunit Na+/H+ antiporter MnhB subunit
MTDARRSRLSTFAFWTAIAGIAIALGGIAAVQLGAIAPMGAFLAFVFGTLVCGAVAAVTGTVSIVRTRGRFGPEDRRRSVTGTTVGVLLVVLVLVASAGGRGKPAINDITTDLTDPPAFAPPAAVPAYAGRDMSYPEEFVPIVREAYPDLEPIEVTSPADDAYARALASARALGWEIVHEDPAAGTFTAIDTSAVFRFVDDVTVRVRPADDGALIDVRSKSRDGRGDLGANAARIERFAAEIKLPPVASRE